MSGPQFTPGPWAIDKQWISGPDDNGHIARVVEYVGEWRAEGEANRNLIAAAPNLYGQLESAQTDLDLLRRAIEENDPKAELLIRVTDLWKRNDAVLAKALGNGSGQ